MPDAVNDERFLEDAMERLVSFVQRQYPGFSREEGQDVVGEAVVRFLRYRREHEIREPLALLYRIAERAAADACRRARMVGGEAGQILIERIPAAPPARDQDGPALAAIMIHDWVAAHRPEDCALFDLRCDGLSHREIADRLAISPDTVRKRYSRLLEEIRRHAGDIGIDRFWDAWTGGERS